MEGQRVLISEKEFLGTGNLYRGLEYLGKCEYVLEIRQSRLRLKKEWPGSGLEETDYLITSILGNITLQDPSIDCLLRKHNFLILHLNDDFLLPLSAVPVPGQRPNYKVFGRIVAEKRNSGFGIRDSDF